MVPLDRNANCKMQNANLKLPPPILNFKKGHQMSKGWFLLIEMQIAKCKLQNANLKLPPLILGSCYRFADYVT
jgi:hypothetical protein